MHRYKRGRQGPRVMSRKGSSSIPAPGVSLGRCPAAGAPALECVAAEAGVVVAELRQAPCLGGVNRILDGCNDLIAILDMLSWNTAGLGQAQNWATSASISTPTNGTQCMRISGGCLDKKAYQKRLIGCSSSPGGVSALILSSSMEGHISLSTWGSAMSNSALS